jgi:uncharacterized protein
MPSMHATGPAVFLRGLTNLNAILDKAIAHADAKKWDALAIGQTRLIADMLPFTRQVQIACDAAKLACSRLLGIDPPKHDDVETTLPELKARVQAVIDYINSFKPEQFEGSDTRIVTLKVQGNDMQMPGQAFLLGFALPNFYFHTTMTYALLRQNGVELGKRDFLGGR